MTIIRCYLFVLLVGVLLLTSSPIFASDWSINHIPDANQPDKIAYCVLERTESNGDVIYLARDKAGKERFLISFSDSLLEPGRFYEVRLILSDIDQTKTHQTKIINAKAMRDTLLLVPLSAEFFDVKNVADYRYARLEGFQQALAFDFGNQWEQWLQALNGCKDTVLDDVSDGVNKSDNIAPKQPLGMGKTLLASQLSKAKIDYSHIDAIGDAHSTVDAIWYGQNAYQGVKGAYKHLLLNQKSEIATQLSPMVEDYLIPIKRLCSGVFVSEVSPVEALNNDYFVRADFACSPETSSYIDKTSDTMSSLLFLSVQNHLHIFMQEAPVQNAAKVLEARDDILFSFK